MKRIIEIAERFNKLSEKEKKIATLRFIDRLPLEEVGKQFYVTRERIRQIEAKILERFRDVELTEKKTKVKTYTAKEIERMLWLPCCHVSGMHDPQHFERREYICERQKSEALERFCKLLGINPETKSEMDCGWCADYKEKKKGEGLKLFEKNGKKRT